MIHHQHNTRTTTRRILPRDVPTIQQQQQQLPATAQIILISSSSSNPRRAYTLIKSSLQASRSSSSSNRTTATTDEDNHLQEQRDVDDNASSPITTTTTILSSSDNNNNNQTTRTTTKSGFELDVALFCGGLAFDAYVEPPTNSSRWERGSKGWNVAFCSPRFTRHLYRGLLQVVVKRISGLPADPENVSGVEQVLTGKGVDACLLVAVLEGSWKEDIQRLEKENYHAGVLDLTGAAHVGRTSTAWSSVDEKASKKAAETRGEALPYHIRANMWGKGGEAVWPEVDKTKSQERKIKEQGKKLETDLEGSNSFYLYVQDPADARLVFTVLDDDRLGQGTAVGSTHKRLRELIPQAAYSPAQWLNKWKKQMLEKGAFAASAGADADANSVPSIDSSSLQATWQGELKLTSKPPKRDKNSQILAGAAAGAYVAGPVGAAAGAFLGSMYESQVQGRIECQLNYLPILPQQQEQQQQNVKPYEVLGGIPGITWGELFRKHLKKQKEIQQEQQGEDDSISAKLARIQDLEHCFFVNHEVTGATCAVYRSLEEKMVIVSFRGTCAPVDLLTDTNLLQEAWKEGEDVKNPNTVKVHAGFRTSLNSISRRLKELVLGTPAPGDDISDYDMLVTGHSLGGALATLFTADIGEYGIDAGRGLPQMQESDAWWKSITTLLGGQDEQNKAETREPPRPKSLHLYNFGSPRVGNHVFCRNFDSLLEKGQVDKAYRLVNGEDVVARLPRTMNALVFGNVGYEHVGTTVLVAPNNTKHDREIDNFPLLWIEGESDDRACPVRDAVAITSPMAEGSLLSDLLGATKASFEEEQENDAEKDTNWSWSKLTAAAEKVTNRMRKVSASDVASLLGIDRDFTARELRLINSVLAGQAIAHHLEDEYYAGLGRAASLVARVGEDIRDLVEEGDSGKPETSEVS